MKKLGTHLILEFYDCSPTKLTDVGFVERTMIDAALAANATIVQSVFHLFQPHGVSGVVVIAESHLSIHTWPELGYAAVDIFTCGGDVKPERALKFLRDSFEAKHISASELDRGILENIENTREREHNKLKDFTYAGI